MTPNTDTKALQVAPQVGFAPNRHARPIAAALRAVSVITTLMLSSTAVLAEVNVDCRSGTTPKVIEGCTRDLALPGANTADKTEALWRRARALIFQKRHDEAAADLNQAQALTPESADVFASRGRLYNVQGDNQKALAEVNAALKLVPTYAYALWLRGLIYTTMGRYGDAKADLDHAIAISPTYSDALAARGRMYRLQNQIALALADLDRAVAISPTWVYALEQRADTLQLNGDYARAITDIDRAIVLQPTNEALKARRQQAVALLESVGGQPPSPPQAVAAPQPTTPQLPTTVAQGPLQQPVPQPPAASPLPQAQSGEAQALLTQARTAFNANDAATVQKHADRLLQISQPTAEVMYWRGWSFAVRNDLTKALADLNQSIELNGGQEAGALFLRGLVHNDLGRPDQALVDAERLIRNSVKDWRGFTLMGHGLALQGRTAQSIASYDMALSLAPNVNARHEDRAFAYLTIKNFAAAEQDANNALRVNARSTRALFLRGRAMLATGRTDQALASFKEALAINPADSSARLGEQLVLVGKALQQTPGSKRQSASSNR